ncbi:hypothetical protein [Oceanirhabdus sp. W0125-5]|nr:hypothetical protein [Oceanirhabdus sp. W0125-5]WBW98138.1 hypothetical protein OW730_05060 [Oceanirhabdus sp. W0125-5]
MAKKGQQHSYEKRRYQGHVKNEVEPVPEVRNKQMSRKTNKDVKI